MSRFWESQHLSTLCHLTENVDWPLLFLTGNDHMFEKDDESEFDSEAKLPCLTSLFCESRIIFQKKRNCVSPKQRFETSRVATRMVQSAAQPPRIPSKRRSVVIRQVLASQHYVFFSKQHSPILRTKCFLWRYRRLLSMHRAHQQSNTNLSDDRLQHSSTLPVGRVNNGDTLGVQDQENVQHCLATCSKSKTALFSLCQGFSSTAWPHVERARQRCFLCLCLPSLLGHTLNEQYSVEFLCLSLSPFIESLV